MKIFICFLALLSFFSCNDIKKEVPKGNEVSFSLYAKGRQEYRLERVHGEKVWWWKTQRLDLFLEDQLVGTVNYLNDFLSYDGSSLRTIAVVNRDDELEANLSKVVMFAGPGIFAGVTYVVREDCKGGEAPREVPDTEPSEIEPYLAEFSCVYHFYTGIED